jgi:acetyl esterase/lipase
MNDTNNSEAWRKDSRLAKAPVTVSRAAQEFLTTMASMPRPPRPAVDDRDGWIAAVGASDAMWEPRVQAMLAASRAKTETREIAGVTVHVATPETIDAKFADCAYLYAHGGAFIFGGGRYAMAHGALAATQLGCTVYSVDYRMAPFHLFPQAPEDCLAVYRALLTDYSPKTLAIGGSSAGGNLALVTALMARDRKLPLPAGLVLLTPEVDLTEAGDTFQTHEFVDVVLQKGVMDCNLVYAGGRDLKEPYLSPLFADYTRHFPRVFIQSGTRDIFLSNCALLHRKMLKAGIDAELHVWEAMPHGGFGGASPEDAEVESAVKDFLTRAWGG